MGSSGLRQKGSVRRDSFIARIGSQFSVLLEQLRIGSQHSVLPEQLSTAQGALSSREIRGRQISIHFFTPCVLTGRWGSQHHGGDGGRYVNTVAYTMTKCLNECRIWIHLQKYESLNFFAYMPHCQQYHWGSLVPRAEVPSYSTLKNNRHVRKSFQVNCCTNKETSAASCKDFNCMLLSAVILDIVYSVRYTIGQYRPKGVQGEGVGGKGGRRCEQQWGSLNLIEVHVVRAQQRAGRERKDDLDNHEVSDVAENGKRQRKARRSTRSNFYERILRTTSFPQSRSLFIVKTSF